MTRPTLTDHTDPLDALEPTTLEDLDVDTGDDIVGGTWGGGTTSISTAPMPS